MKQATFSELRKNAKFFFDMVEAGESVRILRNGKPVADLVPTSAEIPSWKRRTVQPLVIEGVSVSQMILDERQAEE